MSLLFLLCIIFGAIQIFDVVSTFVIIRHDNYDLNDEQTSWLRTLMKKLGLIPALLIKLVIALSGGYYMYIHNETTTLIVMIILYSVLLYMYNWKTLQSIKT